MSTLPQDAEGLKVLPGVPFPIKGDAYQRGNVLCKRFLVKRARLAVGDASSDRLQQGRRQVRWLTLEPRYRQLVSIKRNF